MSELRDDLICKICNEKVNPNNFTGYVVSYVTSKNIQIVDEKTTYILHEKCFEEIAGNEFVTTNFKQQLTTDIK